MAGKIAPNKEVHITYEDQQQINTFARVNGKLSETREELDEKKKELQSLEDAVSEVEVLELEEDTFPCQIGEVFMDFTADQVNERLASEKARCVAEVKAMDERVAEYTGILSDLKVKLYAKFGTSINLEAEDAD